MSKRDDWKYGTAIFMVDEDGLICSVSRGRGSNDWNLPGGKGEEGETPKETAIREALEETGLKISNLVPLMTSHEEGKPVFAFAADWEGKIRPSEEGDVRWVTWDTILDPGNTFSEFNQRLFNLLNGLTD